MDDKTVKAQRALNADFHVATNPDLRYRVYNKSVILTHGDKLPGVSTRNFPGTITANRPECDLLVFGHFHVPLFISTPTSIAGAAIVGSNEYAYYELRAELSAPGANAWVIDSQRGVLDFETLPLDI